MHAWIYAQYGRINDPALYHTELHGRKHSPSPERQLPHSSIRYLLRQAEVDPRWQLAHSLLQLWIKYLHSPTDNIKGENQTTRHTQTDNYTAEHNRDAANTVSHGDTWPSSGWVIWSQPVYLGLWWLEEQPSKEKHAHILTNNGTVHHDSWLAADGVAVRTAAYWSWASYPVA